MVSNTPTISDPIKLTELAAKMIKETIEKDNLDGHGIRVGIIGGGCQGLQNMLDITDGSKKDIMDMEYEYLGVKIVIDYFSASHLMGTVIDYKDGSAEAGFKFNNPNKEDMACGCDLSF